MSSDEDDDVTTGPVERPTFLRRMGMRNLRRAAHKQPGEPLTPEDWEAYLRFGAQPQWSRVRAGHRHRLR